MQKVKTDKMLSRLGQLNDEQFKVLFFIYNTINLNSDNTNRVKIYRAVLADLTGKSERTISRITDKLAEQGLIIKDCVSDGSKLYNYYSLPVTKTEEKVDNRKQKTEENLVTDDTFKRTLKNLKEHKSTEKDLKELESTERTEKVKDDKIEEVEIEKEFEMACGVQVEESDDIPVDVINQYLQLKKHPEEEEISKYLKRIEGIKMLELEYPQLKEKKLAYTSTLK